MRTYTKMAEPQINLARSTRWRMWIINIAALAVIIQSGLSDSFASFFVAAAVLAGALGAELVLHIKTGVLSTIKDGSALATALVLAILLPNTIHPLLAFAGALFSIVVVKYSFGGLGSNWLNPALGGWFFIRFSWPGIFERALEGSILQTLTQQGVFSGPEGSVMGMLKLAGIDSGQFDGRLTSILNSNVFSFFKTSLPEGYVNLFLMPGNGIIADRGLLALVIGTMLITAFQISRFWIPALFLSVYTLLVYIFGALPFGGSLGSGDMLFGLCTGGTLAAAFILLADPVTGPKSHGGAALAALIAGILAFVFRYPGKESYGAFFAVAAINTLVPLIRGVEDKLFFVKRSRP